ncbi:MAG TPA: hypothetical protein VH986_01210 [Acidimicrobiia bacterium]|jgi:hypothetical protein
MARAQRLDELDHVLTGLRAIRELDEVKPGVFYVKRRAFLHFHESARARHADVRDGADWGDPIELPPGPVSKARSETFVREVRRRLAHTLSA